MSFVEDRRITLHERSSVLLWSLVVSVLLSCGLAGAGETARAGGAHCCVAEQYGVEGQEGGTETGQEAEPATDAPEEDPRSAKARAKERKRHLKKAQGGLQAALRKGDYPTAATWVEEIGSLGIPKAIDAVLKVGESFPGDPLRTAVRETLARTTSAGGIRYLCDELSKTKSTHRAMLIIEALEAIQDPFTKEPLLAMLDRAKDPKLAAVVVRALASKPQKEVVDALIRYFLKVQDSQDTVWAETRIALLALTEQSFTHYEDWVNWWEVHRENWAPSSKSDRTEQHRTGIYRGKANLKLPKLFGQEIPSKRVVFVIDTSGSMEKVDKSAREEGAKGGGRNRMERAKAELVAVIRDLRPEVEFNIVAYNTTAVLWKQGRLVKASASNKKGAIKMIAGLQPDGFTSTLEAMLLALNIPEVDTVILVSDGSPTIPDAGTIAELPPIYEKIREVNRFKKIVIHTLGFKGAHIPFMRTVARENGGSFQRIR